MTSPFTTFMTELRRRRVFRVAAVYGGVAFVIVQIIDGTFEVMGVPPAHRTASGGLPRLNDFGLGL